MTRSPCNPSQQLTDLSRVLICAGFKPVSELRAVSGELAKTVGQNGLGDRLGDHRVAATSDFNLDHGGFVRRSASAVTRKANQDFQQGNNA